LEFNEDQGVPNLLLYYDTDDQWPAVYKTTKVCFKSSITTMTNTDLQTCYEKEAVLHVEQNQIINLTTTHVYLKQLSGCAIKPVVPPTLRPTAASTKPTTRRTARTRKVQNRTPVKTVTVELPTPRPTTPTYDPSTVTFEEEFGSTTADLKSQWESVFETSPATPPTKAPIKKRAVRPSPPVQRWTGRTVNCHNARKFRSARERWWFIALSNCNGTRGINVKYKILMTNGPPGDYWHEHFSADEFCESPLNPRSVSLPNISDILPILMAFSIAYSFLMLGIIMCSIELKSRQLLHTTYKIFVVSAIFQLFGIILTSAAYLKYAVNGLGPSKVRRAGKESTILFVSLQITLCGAAGAIFMGASETLYLLLLLLLAKGFTITRGRLPLSASVKLTVFMCLYVVTYISIFIYEANVFDPGEVLYLYESPAGYGLITLRILAWCMFIYSTIFTLKHYPEKVTSTVVLC
jgi:hypothetical protein